MLYFDPFTTPLQTGINLIEASAGTGKTYSITMLVVRYLLESDITIDQLLVVTFTNAAAQELRQRIRQRLLEVRNVLNGEVCEDQGVVDWVASMAVAPEALVKKLTVALADLDYASIVTIHSFCQRTLSQYALESGQGFNAELIDNIAPLKQQIVEDFWRLETYHRNAEQVISLLDVAKTPEQLQKSIAGFSANVNILPRLKSLDDYFEQQAALIRALPQYLSLLLPAILSVQEDQSAFLKKKFHDTFSTDSLIIKQWLEEGAKPSLLPLSALLTLTADMLNGNKLRGEQKKQDFLQQNNLDFSLINQLQQCSKNIAMAFKSACYHYVEAELSLRLTEANQLSHNDVITNLAEAIKRSDTEDGLKILLQKQFPVVMIDEFQDTDQAQWSIFSSFVDDCDNTIYLIGDPKQAIYKFRGADIYSYLEAQRQAQQRYTLAINYRSQQSLVDGINTFFDVENPFNIAEIEYHSVSAANVEPQLFRGEQAYEKLAFRGLEENPDHKKGLWPGNKSTAKNHIQAHVVDEICQMLRAENEVKISGQPVEPADIAILVRSNTTASQYQQALHAVGVTSIINSKSSVFHTQEAQSLSIILTAITQPYNITAIRHALCQPWFGYNGQALYQLLDDVEATEQWLINFQRYHEQWRDQGILVTLNQLMAEHNVVSHLAKQGQLERCLTNINHLLEVLQQYASENKLSMQKLLQWFMRVQHDTDYYDAQVLRLESDADAVKIITVHGSKGLEYPIVFCPDLWGHNKSKDTSIALFTRDTQTYIDLGSEQFQENKEQQNIEENAEALRLLYVAITRAKYRCIVYWATQNKPTSPLAHIIEQHSGEDWLSRLATLACNNPEIIEYSELASNYDATLPLNNNILLANSEALSCRIIERDLNPNPWVMSSYSGLAYHSIDASSLPELPVDKAEENERSALVVDELPKGAHTGNLIHDLLEYNSFASLGESVCSEEYKALRDEGITRYAGDSHFDTDLVDSLLQRTVNTVLSKHDSAFTLANLDEAQCLKEMPFYFKVENLNTQDVNELLRHDPAYLELNWQQMRGQLTGFIDLVCEYQGRYYVMDYKTNYLEHYSEETMTHAMHEHNYGLQYWIYSLVLHRYLKQTLMGYDFNEHFGGVRYLFVRGMNPEIPCSGVFESYPQLSILDDLGAAFNV